MEGANGESAQFAAQKFFDSRAHFFGGFVGEGDRHNFKWRRPLLNQVGDAMSQHARLARSRSSDDQRGPGFGSDGFDLLGV